MPAVPGTPASNARLTLVCKSLRFSEDNWPGQHVPAKNNSLRDLAAAVKMEGDINGVKVSFPYTPYPVQVNYMSKVIDSIRSHRFGLLESPTGTGKTLSLLCAALSWTQQGGKERIVYTSRTHSQLSNVVKELKKTTFKPTVSHIASRRKLCLHPEVQRKSPSLQSSLCRTLRSHKACPYHFDDKMTSEAATLTEGCLDIEDFITECQRRQFCPYLVAQLNSQTADLVLAPYTYIIDPTVRDHLPLDIFMGSILIFDEAHNIPDALSSGMSFNIPFNVVKVCSECLDRLARSEFEAKVKGREQLENVAVGSAAGMISKWRNFLEKLQKRDKEFAKLMAGRVEGHEAHQQRDAAWLFDMFEECNITDVTVGQLSDSLESIGKVGGAINLAQHEQNAIDMITRLLRILFKRNEGRAQNVEFVDTYFAVCLTDGPALSLICFSPKPGFDEITHLFPRTIIMTSGTLSPMNSFAEELGHEFPVQLENEHVADPSQVFVGVIPKGVTQKQFLFTYQHRKNTAMKKELVETLKSAFSRVPSGVLTFFPSFAMLDEFSKLVSAEQRSMHKEIFCEPRDNDKLTEVLKSFERKANSTGAAMLAVCRGKTSEGLDFADDAARCVCVVGIPFPNASDFRVNLKREWLDKKKKGSGSRWYTESAMRAVNQAIGRAIRHKEDYAAVLLFDERYIGFKRMISKWIQPSIHEFANWEEAIDDFEYFFAQRRGITVKPPSKRQPKAAAEVKPVPKTVQLNGVFSQTIQGQKEKVAKKEVEQPRIVDRAIHLRENSRSQPIQRKDAGAGLQSFLWASSMTDSQKEELRRKKVADGDRAGGALASERKKGSAALLEQLTKKATGSKKVVALRECAQCHDKNGTEKMSCGHIFCKTCFELNQALGMSCSVCSGK